MADRMGLVQAAQQLGAYGRGPDRQLAHISPDESEFLDYLQGGRRTNPHTGLPEYSMFGKVLKAVARVAGAVGGFMLGGPAGAAIGSGAATKLTGGSWKDALKGAAMSGIGGYAAQGLSGGGWGLTGGSIGANTVTGAAAQGLMPEGVQAAPGIGAALSNPAISVANPGLSGAAFMDTIKSAPGIGVALGALSTPTNPSDPYSPDMSPPPGFGGNINLKVAPQQRAYQPYTGDYAHFGEPGGGGGWSFFDNVNPKPQFLAEGGGVLSPRGPGSGLMGIGQLRNPGIPSQIQSPQMANPMQAHAMARDMSPMAQRDEIRRAAIMGYMNAKDGGPVTGPGTGTSDSIPAMLSAGEHIIDQATVKDAGNGSLERGHKAIELWKQKQRRKAGVKNPKKPPAFQGAAHG